MSILLCFASGLQAEVAISPADQDAINRQQKMLLEQAQQQRESLQNSLSLPSSPEPAPGTSAGTCQKISQIVFQGAEHLSSSVKRKLTGPRLGHCLTLRDINQLVRETTAAYLKQGYITSRAWLPQQDISGGVLTVAASEGRIAAISIDGQEPLALKMAFPGLAGSILNLRDLEQGLDQLNRLSSRQFTIDIRPDSRPGYSRVVLRPGSSRLPFTVTLGADNSGQKSSGTGQMNTSLVVDNPLYLADQWMISAARDDQFCHCHRSRSLSGSVTIPYGYWLFSYQTFWNDFYQDVPFQGTSYRYQGSTLTQRIDVNRTLLRDGQQKLALNTALSHRRAQTRLAQQRLMISSPTLTSLNIALNYSRTLGGGYLTLSPAVSRGLHIMGATPDDPQFPGVPRSGFRKFSLSASYFYPVTASLYYLTSIYGQTSPDNLYPSERIFTGGQYSVRGFKEHYLTGNQGAYWRNELNWQLITMPGVGSIGLTGALDTGWTQKRAGNSDGGSVTGAAFGISFSNRWFSQTITAGKPLAWSDSIQPDHWVAYWQATFTL